MGLNLCQAKHSLAGRRFQFPFGKQFSFQPKQLPPCQPALEGNYAQLSFKMTRPANSSQPLSRFSAKAGKPSTVTRRDLHCHVLTLSFLRDKYSFETWLVVPTVPVISACAHFLSFLWSCHIEATVPSLYYPLPNVTVALHLGSQLLPSPTWGPLLWPSGWKSLVIIGFS